MVKQTTQEKETPQENIQDDLVEGLTSQVQRLQAEFENYIKREEKQKEEQKKFAKKELLKELLTIYDDFDRALQAAEESETTKGFALVFTTLKKLLMQEGITPIDAKGQLFNPEYHEVLRVQETNNPQDDNIVVEEYQKGYLLYNKVLRTSKVCIMKLKEEEDTQTQKTTEQSTKTQEEQE